MIPEQTHNEMIERDLNEIYFINHNPSLDEALQDDNFFKLMCRTIYNFRAVYYGTFIWAAQTKYMGIEILKYPTDMWIYQEIVFETKPDIIIETGTWKGGSSLFFAHILDALGSGMVITIDNNVKPDLPEHTRIKYITGDCLSEEVSKEVNKYMNGGKVMVNLDSCHNKDHVLKEMEIYSKYVTPGCYMIVEDTFINHPIQVKDTKTGEIIYPGPMEAVDEFVKTHKEFEVDKRKEKFLLTQNPNGYLRRVHA